MNKNQSLNTLISWGKGKWWILVIIALGFIVYSNSFQNSFHFDDHFYITDSKFVNDIGELSKIKYWKNPHFRIYPTLSFALNHKLDGFNIWGYHLVNIFLHIICAIFVFLLSKELISLNNKESHNKKTSNILPCLIALLFLLHPVQTSTVNYIVQRMTIMSSMFYILGVWLYIKARLNHINALVPKAILFYFFTFLVFYLSLFSKQIAASFPLMIFVVELLFIRNKEGKPAKIYLLVLGGVLLLGSGLLLLSNYLPIEFDKYTREIYLASQFEVILRYWRLLLFPYPLNFDPFVEVADSIWSLKYLLLGAVHILIISFAVWYSKKNKLVAFGVFWFYIALLVESSIIPIRDLMYEHRMYLPSFGFVLLVSVFLFDFLQKKYHQTIAVVVFSVLILVSSIWSYKRNKVWESDISLWSDVVKNTPSKARAHKYLGAEYLKKGDLKLSLYHLNTAIKKQPDKEWEPYSNRASVYKLQKKYHLAIDDISKSIQMDPEIAWFYTFRAEMYLKVDKYDLALYDINKSISLDDNQLNAYFLRSECYLKKNNLSKALRDINYILFSEPENVQALYSRAMIYVKKEENQKAIDDFSIMLEKHNDLYDIFKFRGDAYYRLGDYQASIIDYSHSIRLNNKNGRAFYKRAWAYYKLGQYEESFRDIKNARSLGVRGDSELFSKLMKLIN